MYYLPKYTYLLLENLLNISKNEDHPQALVIDDVSLFIEYVIQMRLL